MIVVRAPFRIPIGGGGTDLPAYYKKYGGYLITGAINKYMYININVAASVKKIKLNYSKVEIVDDVEEIKHDIIRETFKYLKFNDKIEISSMADASAGTGLGSSSSYTVGLLSGMNALLNRNISKLELAEEACHIEINKIGKPIGKQDQYASALGGIFSMEIDIDGKVITKPIKIKRETIKDLEYRLLMFYTNIKRDANEILGEQFSKANTSEEETITAMHDIKKIGKQIEIALVKGEIDIYGELMHEHWLTKKRISNKMSSNKIDDWYSLALESGALGGKIMGAGGGGFFLFYVKNGQRSKLIKEMERAGLHYMDTSFDFEGAKILLNI